MNRPPDHGWIVLNGKRILATEARISPLSEGFMFGLGVFETIKVLGGRPIFFADHFVRLRRAAAELSLPFTTSAAELRARCCECLAANELADGGLKIVVFQDAADMSELILTRSPGYQQTHYARGFRLQTVRDGRREDWICGLKTLNYLKCLVAKRAAQAAGCDEALFVDSGGRVLEGSNSNVFVVKEGGVFTPALDQGILPGTARARVLQLLGNENVREGVVPVRLLFEADEVFVTNSLLGVMPVARIDEQRYNLDATPATKSIMEEYRALEQRSADEQAIEG
jgi:branched-subunit amino acid aminotransferase/4-amino-4-deoxychorismate lyase